MTTSPTKGDEREPDVVDEPSLLGVTLQGQQPTHLNGSPHHVSAERGQDRKQNPGMGIEVGPVDGQGSDQEHDHSDSNQK